MQSPCCSACGCVLCIAFLQPSYARGETRLNRQQYRPPVAAAVSVPALVCLFAKPYILCSKILHKEDSKNILRIAPSPNADAFSADCRFSIAAIATANANLRIRKRFNFATMYVPTNAVLARFYMWALFRALSYYCLLDRGFNCSSLDGVNCLLSHAPLQYATHKIKRQKPSLGGSSDWQQGPGPDEPPRAA